MAPEVHSKQKFSYEPLVSDISESEDNGGSNSSEKVLLKSAPSISTSIMEVFLEARKRRCDSKIASNGPVQRIKSFQKCYRYV